MILPSCGKSPEAMGKSLAEKMNECGEQYLAERQQAESDFVANFNSSNYSTRSAALEAYVHQMDEVANNYYSRRDEILEEISICSGDYAEDYKKLSAFESDYEDNLDNGLVRKVAEKINSREYSSAVLAKVRSLIPVKPDEEQIKKDLVNENIGEGFDKDQCWFREDHRWTFKEYDINDFVIEDVVRDTDKEYVAIANMRLNGETNAFDAKVKVSYVLPDTTDWKIEFVSSMGVSIVPTHKYDDLINCEIKDDGWGGTYALFVTNNSNIDLLVGAEIQCGNTKHRTNRVVKADGGCSQFGGLFAGGSVTSYRIAFVERP